MENMSEENNDLKSKLVSGLKIDVLRQISRLMSDYTSSVELFDLEGLIETEVEKRVQARLDEAVKLEREKMREEINKVIDMGERSEALVESEPVVSASEAPRVEASEPRDIADYVNEALDASSGEMEETSDRVIAKPLLNEEPTSGLNDDIVFPGDVIAPKPVLDIEPARDLNGDFSFQNDKIIDKPVLNDEPTSDSSLLRFQMK